MKKFIKFSIISLLPILFILFIILSVNVFVSDWRLAHKFHSLYQPPFNWALYKTEVTIFKFARSLLNNKATGLPAIHIYVSEKSQKKLVENTPQSTKKWVGGFFLLNNENLQKIKLRYRGDNPINWMFEKKSWRIKTRKSEIIDQQRYFEYWPYKPETYIPGSLANRMGVLSPKFRLIELFINDESSGIYIETEKINEGFLRRNGLMPINLYKGEQNKAEEFIGVEMQLFNNPGAWKKVSIFNQIDEKDKSDLKYFLSLMIKATIFDQAFAELLQRAEINTWAKVAAYQILAQDFHTDEMHNMRLALDPWSGIAHPVVIDPISNIDGNSVLPFEISSHRLFALLNKSSLFNDAKYKKIQNYVEKHKVLTQEATSLRNLEKAISTSSKRDITLSSQLFKSINWKESIKKRKIVAAEGKSARKKLAQNLERHENNIIKKLYTKPNVSWNNNLNGFTVYIDGEIPISDLIINYKSNLPKWVAIDLDANGIIDDNEYKFTSKIDNNIIIPVRLYSNRINVHNSIYEMNIINSYKHVKSVNTKFNIITENSSTPISISGINPFSKERFIIDKSQSKAVLPNRYNIPIYNDKNNQPMLDDNIKVFSGVINVANNLIINNKSKIYPGTKFKLAGDVSIIFKNKVVAEGNSEEPIIFEKKNLNSESWGTIALQGNKTQGSVFTNIIMDGGSGGIVDQIHYTSMLSLHNSKDVIIRKIKMKNNSKYDDMLHIIYCNNITIDDAILENANSDAIDVDISKKIIIRNAVVIKPKNDSIDLMETEALIESSYMTGSGDKAISVGENSNVIIYNSILHKNNIGLATKDGSNAYILYSNLENNKMQLSAYKKNWQYGKGGNAQVFNSYFVAKTNNFNSENKSKVLIDDSSIVGKVNLAGKDLIFQDDVDFFNSKNISNNQNISIDHPLFSYILPVKNKNKRGSDLSNKKFAEWYK